MKKILLLLLLTSVSRVQAQDNHKRQTANPPPSITETEAQAEVQQLFQKYLFERRKMLSAEKWQPIQHRYDSLFCQTFTSFFRKDPKLGITLLDKEFRRLEAISPSWKTANQLMAELTELPPNLTNDPVVIDLKKRLSTHIYARPGAQIQDLILPGIYGPLIDTRDYRGQYLLLDFWGSWCEPCIKKNELLRTHYAELREKGLTVLSVMMDFKDKPYDDATLETALEKDPSYPWPHAVLFKDEKTDGIVYYYRAYMLPKTALIDPDGQVIATDVDTPEALLKIIDPESR